MAARKYSIGKSAFEEFRLSLDMLSEGINDPEFIKYIARIIGKLAVKKAKKNVENGGLGSDGLSEYTIEITRKLRKVDRDENNPPLNESGELLNSIKILNWTVSLGNVLLEIGVKDPDVVKYAETLEIGGTTGGAVGGKWGGYIPPRPYLIPALREAFYESLDGRLEQYIINAMKIMQNGGNWRSYLNSVELWEI